MSTPTLLFRSSAVLWVIWGLVHVFAGVMTMYLPTGADIAGIADAVDPATITAITYPDAAGAILDQHGWNLAWVGLTTVVCAYPIWQGKFWGVAVAALTGGLTDIGYFLFLDLGGYVHFVPGTVMTIVSATAIVTSFAAAYMTRDAEPA